MDIWDKLFNNGPSKICGRQPLKNLKGHGVLKADHSLSNFLKTVFHIFYLVRSWLLCLMRLFYNLHIFILMSLNDSSSASVVARSPHPPYTSKMESFGTILNESNLQLRCLRGSWEVNLNTDYMFTLHCPKKFHGFHNPCRT